MSEASENIDGVVLAAGKSTRMHRWKMLLPYGDSTIVECSVRNAMNVCSRVTVVAGYRANELDELFRDWKSVTVAVNPNAGSEMFSSIQTGARFVHTQRFFLALGDMPRIEPAIYRLLQSFLQTDAVMPKHNGRIGHPILLSAHVRKRILESPVDSTLARILAGFSTLAIPVETAAVLDDIDTPEDYRTNKR